jgi:hypothetical protein
MFASAAAFIFCRHYLFILLLLMPFFIIASAARAPPDGGAAVRRTSRVMRGARSARSDGALRVMPHHAPIFSFSLILILIILLLLHATPSIFSTAAFAIISPLSPSIIFIDFQLTIFAAATIISFSFSLPASIFFAAISLMLSRFLSMLPNIFELVVFAFDIFPFSFHHYRHMPLFFFPPSSFSIFFIRLHFRRFRRYCLHCRLSRHAAARRVTPPMLRHALRRDARHGARSALR